MHWFNNNAQYWTKASGGKYTSPLMKPGSYTMKMYRDEFSVAQDTVTITAGGRITKNIASTESNPSVIWRIGDFDGQPLELKNGDKIERMHPSDTRMATWGGTYTVGTSQARDFPMALFAKEGGVATVNFNLAADQLSGVVLRVGTTLSFKTGRPNVKINNWQGSDPGAPVSHISYQVYYQQLIEVAFDRLSWGDPWRLSWIWRGLYLECTRHCTHAR